MKIMDILQIPSTSKWTVNFILQISYFLLNCFLTTYFLIFLPFSIFTSTGGTRGGEGLVLNFYYVISKEIKLTVKVREIDPGSSPQMRASSWAGRLVQEAISNSSQQIKRQTCIKWHHIDIGGIWFAWCYIIL